MISKGDVRFNCCESTLIRVDDKKPLSGFGDPVMRIASNFGGGVAGWGSACGAVTGAAMAIGLLMGTNGTEDAKTYEEKRERMRDITQKFNQAFEEEWGHINCYDLLGVNTRTPEGKERYEEMKARVETKCANYVEWASEKILEMVES
jgi:C_GCAxxG_C_C family probable redox protein